MLSTDTSGSCAAGVNTGASTRSVETASALTAAVSAVPVSVEFLSAADYV